MAGFVINRPLAHRRTAAPPTAGWLAWLNEVLQAIATRRRLAEMDDRMLKDIGISRADARLEAERAPWDIGPRVR